MEKAVRQSFVFDIILLRRINFHTSGSVNHVVHRCRTTDAVLRRSCLRETTTTTTGSERILLKTAFCLDRFIFYLVLFCITRASC